jgi:peptidoglycan/LPS O-acetylase OafA/YrhL
MNSVAASRRIAGLDTLRALAIVLVIVAHYPKPESGLFVRLLNFGWIGVDLFFVLSGYLIGGQLFAAIVRERDLSLGNFYARRFFRTLPNYYIVLAIYAVLSVAIAAGPLPGWKYTFFLQNFAVPPMFTPSWSLCVEEHFYLVFPLIVLLIARRCPSIGPAVFAGILVAEVAVRSTVWSISRPDLLPGPDALRVYMGSLYFPTYCRLDGLTLGVGIAALKWFRPRIWQRLRLHGNLLLAGSGVFLAASVLALWKRYSWTCSVLGFTLISISFALLTISALSDRSLVGRWRIPGVGAIALLSYSLYLTHSLALDFSAWLNTRLALSMISLPGALISAAAIAWFAVLLYVLVERPFLGLRDRLFRAETIPSVSETVYLVSKA